MPQPQQQAFANGGIVGYKNGGPIGYEVGGPVELMEAYNQRLSGMDADRDMAQRMALINIGAQIMAGRSRNTLKNIGTGLSAALPSYQQSMERLNTQEMQAMRDQIDLARQMEQDRLAQANFERDAQLDELRIGAAEEEAKYANLPEGARNVLLRQQLEKDNPDLFSALVASEQTAADEALSEDNLRLSSNFNSINKTVARRYFASDGTPTDAVPSDIRDLLDSVDPTEVAAGHAQLQQLIKREAVSAFRVSHPDHWSFADRVEKNLDMVGGAPGASLLNGEKVHSFNELP
jgi:hypothetical protein